MDHLHSRMRVNGRPDGRFVRSETTRAHIIKAYLSLLRSGDSVPAKANVIALAGCSLRTLYHHFPTQSVLNDAAAAHIQELERPSVRTVGDLNGRIDAFIASCADSWERWLPLCPLAALPKGRVGGIKKLLERQVRERTAMSNMAFAPEFAAMSSGVRRKMLLAIEAAVSLEAWARLRHQRGMSIAATSDVLKEVLERLLSRGPELANASVAVALQRRPSPQQIQLDGAGDYSEPRLEIADALIK